MFDDTRSEALLGYQTDESLVTEYAFAFEEDDDEADLTQESAGKFYHHFSKIKELYDNSWILLMTLLSVV
ncbi:9804_t:CDS:2 [Funneliformis caledonium]|uniref:9804_t:CDS:1 n=1 Tax=Funneliformis caledonium TaxID=1117310 RepID=A0A9N9HSE3_9GLOM|nr:9804_t:CDS:2 [Funneliformis caledonium]